jgi:hypothetical protein
MTPTSNDLPPGPISDNRNLHCRYSKPPTPTPTAGNQNILLILFKQKNCLCGPKPFNTSSGLQSEFGAA